MSIQPSILCPHCAREFQVAVKIESGKIVVEPKEIQIELPLGPTVVHKREKNKLDAQGPNFQAERPRDTNRIGSNANSDSSSFEPLTERDSNRFVSDSGFASCEEDLIDSIRRIVGEKDWAQNAAGWRSVVKTDPVP